MPPPPPPVVLFFRRALSSRRGVGVGACLVAGKCAPSATSLQHRQSTKQLVAEKPPTQVAGFAPIVYETWHLYGKLVTLER